MLTSIGVWYLKFYRSNECPPDKRWSCRNLWCQFLGGKYFYGAVCHGKNSSTWWTYFQIAFGLMLKICLLCNLGQNIWRQSVKFTKIYYGELNSCFFFQVFSNDSKISTSPSPSLGSNVEWNQVICQDISHKYLHCTGWGKRDAIEKAY